MALEASRQGLPVVSFEPTGLGSVWIRTHQPTNALLLSKAGAIELICDLIEACDLTHYPDVEDLTGEFQRRFGDSLHGIIEGAY